MNCPRCSGVVLDETVRDGVVVDVCRACRGVWLDRGELEKIVARATRELQELSPPRDGGSWRSARYDRDDDDHDDDDRRDPRKKRRWFDTFGDLFD